MKPDCSTDGSTGVRWRATTVALWVAVTGIATGCAAGREPVYAAPELESAVIERIGVLPIVDRRPDPFEQVEVVAFVRRAIVRALEEKGYTPVVDILGPAQREKVRDLATMSDGELARLAPADVPFLLWVALDRVERAAEDLGDTTRVKLSARLIDVQRGVALWRDTAEGEADLAGLLTVLSGPATEGEAVYDAARLLVSTLPDGPRGRRPSGGLRPLPGGR